MLIFTPKAKQTIGNAIFNFGNDSQRAIWQNWIASHPEARRGPNDPWDDGKGPMSDDVRAVALSSLRNRFDMLMNTFKSGSLSEDDAADLNDDLAYIRSIVNSLENPPVPG
jgi:hypothetical protein